MSKERMQAVLAQTDQRRTAIIEALGNSQETLSDPTLLRLYLTALADQDRSAIGAARIQVESEKSASAEALQQMFLEMSRRDRQDPFRQEVTQDVPPETLAPVLTIPELKEKVFDENHLRKGDDTIDTDSFYDRMNIQ